MNSSEFRAEARKRLGGKWGKAALITLAYVFIVWLISFVGGLTPEGLASLISIGEVVIFVPLGFGLTKAYVKLYNGEDVQPFDFFPLGFDSFGKSWGIAFSMLGKLIVPFILIIVSYIMLIFGSVGLIVSNSAALRDYSSMSGGFSALGIIGFCLLIVSTIWYTMKSYYYQLSYVIAAENENMSSKDAVNKSRELMDGKRGKLFCLQLSFIGWAILTVFTLYIGYLWLMPYMQFAIIAFYKFALGNKVDIFAEKEPEKKLESTENTEE